MRRRYQSKQARKIDVQKIAGSYELKAAAVVVAPAATGIAVWKTSDYLRTRKLKAKKLGLEADLKKAEEDSSFNLLGVGVKMSQKLMADPKTRSLVTTQLSEAVKTGDVEECKAGIKTELTEQLKNDPEVMGDLQGMLMSEFGDMVEAKGRIKEIKAEIKKIEGQIDAQHAAAKADGFIGGGSALVPIIVWLVFRKVHQAMKDFRANVKETVERLKTLHELKKEGVDVEEAIKAARIAKETGEKPERPSRPSAAPEKKAKKKNPKKEIQSNLYLALQPYLGEYAGKTAKSVVNELGKETAEKIIENSESAYGILCENSDRMSKAMDRMDIPFGTVLNLLHPAVNRNGENVSNGGNEKDIAKLNSALWYLSSLKIDSGIKTSELRRIISKAGFSVSTEPGKGGGHPIVYYGDEPVRCADGRVKSFPHYQSSVKTVALKEIITTCTDFLERKLAEQESPEADKKAG